MHGHRVLQPPLPPPASPAPHPGGGGQIHPSLLGALPLPCVCPWRRPVQVFNPPYVPTPDEEVCLGGIASAWAGGFKGRRVIDQVLLQVRRGRRGRRAPEGEGGQAAAGDKLAAAACIQLDVIGACVGTSS